MRLITISLSDNWIKSTSFYFYWCFLHNLYFGKYKNFENIICRSLQFPLKNMHVFCLPLNISILNYLHCDAAEISVTIIFHIIYINLSKSVEIIFKYFVIICCREHCWTNMSVFAGFLIIFWKINYTM